MRIERKSLSRLALSFQVDSMILLENFSIEIIEFIQPSSTWKVEVEGVEDATASASTLSTRGGRAWFNHID